jgi:hypothetical protein
MGYWLAISKKTTATLYKMAYKKCNYYYIIQLLYSSPLPYTVLHFQGMVIFFVRKHIE